MLSGEPGGSPWHTQKASTLLPEQALGVRAKCATHTQGWVTTDMVALGGDMVLEL
jgi:hypothetical protein